MTSFHLHACATLVLGAAAALSALPVCAASDLEPAMSPAADHARSASLEAANKNVIGELSRAMLGHAPVDSLGRYFANDLIQHDPLIRNGRHAMLMSIDALRKATPAPTLTVKHILADGDMVFVHAQVSDTPANEMSGTNRYDFYRLDHGAVVEHWLVTGDAPTSSANGNSEFSNLYAYPTPAPALSAERVEMNRLLVATLSNEVFGQRNFALLDRLWNVNYIQHNPYIATGRQALADVLQYIAPEGSHYQIARSMADGDLAVVCSHNTDPGDDPGNAFSGAAVCDIYRVANVELVEHWDVAQDVPHSSASGNSMFSNLYRGDR